jgi:predicted RNase H-like nuclease (RuvC/YqgF family)
MQHYNREDIYKREIAEMQAQNHHLMIRIKELSKEKELLLKQLEEMRNTHIPLR